METEEAIRPCSPATEKELPNRAKDRVDRELPRCVKSKMLAEDPQRPKLLKENELPKCVKPMMLMWVRLPKTACPKTLTEDPLRAKLRKERLLPMVRKFNVDMAEPNLA
jgi:hypothetical protein